MLRPSGIAMATFVALALVSGSAFAQEQQQQQQQAKPKSSGGPTWSSGLGLVEVSAKTEEEKAEDKPAAQPAALPHSSVSGSGVRAFGGFDKIAGRESLGGVLGAAFRFEARHLRSLFAPWVDAAFSGTFPDSEMQVGTTNFDLALRGGLDVHPARLPWIAAGPFIGYRQLHTVQTPKTPEDAPSTSAMLQGLDVGGQIHFRTLERPTETGVARPALDAILYTFVQTAGVAGSSDRVFAGALISAGADARFFANIEGCASDAATCFPRQLRATAGIGGMW